MKRAGLILLLAWLGHMASAQAPDSLYGGRLEGSGIAAALSSMAFSGEVADSAMLRSAPNLSDVLRQFSGVQLKDYGGVGGLKTINVRSLGSEHTAVFIDGVPLDNAQNAQVDLGRFSPGDFASARLGSGRTGSPSGLLRTARELGAANSVSLTTSSLPFEQERRDAFRLRLRGGSFSTFSPSVTWARKLRHSIAQLSAEAVSSSGRYRFHERKYQTLPDGRKAGYDTVMTRENGDLQSFRAQARLGGSRGRDSWLATAYWYDSERGLPGPVVRRPQGAVMSKDRQEDRDAFLQASWTREEGPWSARILAKYSFNHTRYRTNPEEDPQAMPIDNRFDQRAGYMSISGVYRLLPGWNAVASADLRAGKLDSDMRDFVMPRRLEGWAAVQSDYRSDKVHIDAALQYTIAADRFAASGQKGAFSREARTRQAFSPSIVAEYSPWGNGLLFSSFAKRTYRMPTFNDLYYTLVGNIDLKPEDARQVDFGASYRRGAGRSMMVDISAEGYYNLVKDKIVAVPTSNQFRWTMYNIGEVHIAGAEARAGFVWNFGNRRKEGDAGISVMARYTFQKAGDYSQPGKMTWGGQIPYVPVNSGSLSAAVFAGGWRLDFNALFNGKRWSSSANTEDFEIPAFYTMDVWLSKTLLAGGNAMTFSLSANNILGRQYEIVKGYPMPGFNIIAAVEYSF